MKTWFITGCSSGFGKVLCQQVLARGDQLVATARNPATLDFLKPQPNLLILKLDVNSNPQIADAVKAAQAKFGRIDVLVNNAGYGHMGALEEITEDEIRKNFDTNFFGLIEVTRAILPIMRAQKSGRILNMSSVAGVAAIAGGGIYAATKFALEGISEALAAEVAPFNIKITLIEPGAFRTDFHSGALKNAAPMKEYDESLATTRKFYQTIGGNQPGDPEKAAAAMIELVDHPTPPLRLVMGNIALQRVKDKLDLYQKEMKEWEKVSRSVDF